MTIRSHDTNVIKLTPEAGPDTVTDRVGTEATP
jgi:hypothetical protein